MSNSDHVSLGFWVLIIIANNYFAHDKPWLGVTYMLLAAAVLAIRCLA